jgi:uncharacterized protein YceH (UPF0502 family)
MHGNETDAVLEMLEALRLTFTIWVAKLEARIARLEQRVAELERRGTDHGPG